VQIAVELDNSLKAESCSSMSWGTVLEGLNIVGDSMNWDFKMLGSLCEHFWVMNSLGSSGNLFSSHEEIVRVGVVWISWVQHGIEWSSIGWISVEHVEISFILILDEFTQHFFISSIQVLKRLLSNSCILEHLDTLFEAELNNWGLALEIFEWVLLLYGIKLWLVSLFETLEEEGQHVSEKVEDLEVMLLDFHLHIKTGELTQMTVSVRLLSSENWTNLKDSLQITAKSHLLVKLWTLSKTSFLSEVVELEHIGSSL